MPTTAINDTDQKSEERKWQESKNLLDTNRNIHTALIQLFKRAIDLPHHSGGMTNIGMARRGFGNDKPPAIIERFTILYRTPILQ